MAVASELRQTVRDLVVIPLVADKYVGGKTHTGPRIE